MFEILLTIIALSALTIASLTDLKSREVPDWLSYGVLFAALGIRLIFSLFGEWSIFLSGLFGFAVLFGVGYIFYAVSQWGGGDAKLLMGMGAIIGINIPFSASSLQVVWYFLALLVVGSVYGLGWMIFLALKSWSQTIQALKVKVRDYYHLHLALIILSGMFILLTLLNTTFWPFIFVPLPLFYLFIAINLVEQANFYRKVSPTKLTEGDWMVEEVKLNGKVIMEKKTLEREDILKLQKLEKEEKVKTILIKDGIPFIPSFLLAYLLFVFGEKVWSTVLSTLF